MLGQQLRDFSGVVWKEGAWVQASNLPMTVFTASGSVSSLLGEQWKPVLGLMGECKRPARDQAHVPCLRSDSCYLSRIIITITITTITATITTTITTAITSVTSLPHNTQQHSPTALGGAEEQNRLWRCPAQSPEHQPGTLPPHPTPHSPSVQPGSLVPTCVLMTPLCSLCLLSTEAPGPATGALGVCSLGCPGAWCALPSQYLWPYYVPNASVQGQAAHSVPPSWWAEELGSAFSTYPLTSVSSCHCLGHHHLVSCSTSHR